MADLRIDAALEMKFIMKTQSDLMKEWIGNEGTGPLAGADCQLATDHPTLCIC